MSLASENPTKFELQEQVILVVDDKPVNLGVVANYLKNYNFKVLVARDNV